MSSKFPKRITVSMEHDGVNSYLVAWRDIDAAGDSIENGESIAIYELIERGHAVVQPIRFEPNKVKAKKKSGGR